MTTHETFASLCDGVFGVSPHQFGFTGVCECNEYDYASRTYRADNRYIVIYYTSHFRDGSAHAGIYLGEGSDQGPEEDWNKIPLCQLDGANGSMLARPQIKYWLGLAHPLTELLPVILADLKTHAQDFLAGSLERFRVARAHMNQSREPYRIYAPDAEGRYTMTYDEMSTELKRRFS